MLLSVDMSGNFLPVDIRKKRNDPTMNDRIIARTVIQPVKESQGSRAK